VWCLYPTPSPDVSAILPDPTFNPTAGWKEYSNTDYKFSLKYPKEFALKDDGPNGINYNATEAAKLAGTELSTERVISFTDTNKQRFTLNIYPASDKPDLAALPEYNGKCGVAGADRTLVNKIAKEGSINYKLIYQNLGGKTLTDYCFFNGAGNLLVLRNINSSTEITMKLILSTITFQASK
jgi:hypothetical protein